LDQEKIRRLGLKRFDQPYLWENSARLMLTVGADPDDWVDDAFQFCTIPNGPFPQNLQGKAILNWYDLYRRDEIENSSYNIELDFNAAGQIITDNPGEDIKDILLDEYYSIRPYVRCILGHMFPEVLDRWKSDAEVECILKPRLKENLRELDIDIDEYFGEGEENDN